MAQKKIWIVKWLPDGHEPDVLRGQNNRAYKTFKAASTRCQEVANDGRREVGVFELVAAYRPKKNVESIPIVGCGRVKKK